MEPHRRSSKKRLKTRDLSIINLDISTTSKNVIANLMPIDYKTPIKKGKLSKKSQNIVNKLIKKFGDSASVTHLEPETAFSLEFRYGDLLSHQTNLYLPAHLKLLYLQQAKLDSIINSYNAAGKSLVFKKLKYLMENKFRRVFSFSEFAKLIFFVPHFYTVRKEKGEIHTNIPHDYAQRNSNAFLFSKDKMEVYNTDRQLTLKEIEERQDVLRKVMIQYCISKQTAFLQSKGIRYNSKATRVWNSEFDLESVEVPEYQFDFGGDSQRFSEFLKTKEIDSVLEPEVGEEDDIQFSSFLSEKGRKELRLRSKAKKLRKDLRLELDDYFQSESKNRKKVRIGRQIEMIMNSKKSIDTGKLTERLERTERREDVKETLDELVSEGFLIRLREGKTLTKSKDKHLKQIKG